ncbi:MAG: helix-turn-helix domain-containing protein [Dehalococcoidia bacterium]
MMELLTIHETAQVLKVSPMTVRRFIQAGRLPAVRIGKGVRVRKEAVDRLITPVAPASEQPTSPRPSSKVFTPEDSLFNIIGMAHSGGPRDVAENKQRYLADAYAAEAEHTQ